MRNRPSRDTSMRLTAAMAFQPEIRFAAKGHRIRDNDAQPITASTGEMKFPAADRVILVRYLDKNLRGWNNAVVIRVSEWNAVSFLRPSSVQRPC
jgi:hypothetical protein